MAPLFFGYSASPHVRHRDQIDFLKSSLGVPRHPVKKYLQIDDQVGETQIRIRHRTGKQP